MRILSMRAYPKALSDAHAPKPWLSVQTDPSAESSSVVPATSAWWAQRTAPLRATATTAKTPALPRKCAFSSMRAYPKVLNDAHAPKPWLSVQTMTRAESLSVVPATSAWWVQRTAPSPATAKTAGRGGLSVDLGRRALSSTCSRNALPTKLHQPATNITYKRLMGPDDRW